MTDEASQSNPADAGRLERPVVPLHPKRVQLSRTAGWRMPPETVSVARPGLWGNPFYRSRWRDAETCVALFENSVRGAWNPATSEHLPDAWRGYGEHCDWLQRWRRKMNASPADWLPTLRGKNLACWCALDAPCHADVLLRLANHERHNVQS